MNNNVIILSYGISDNNVLIGVYETLNDCKQTLIKEHLNSILIFEDYKEGFLVTIISIKDRNSIELYARIWDVEKFN